MTKENEITLNTITSLVKERDDLKDKIDRISSLVNYPVPSDNRPFKISFEGGCASTSYIPTTKEEADLISSFFIELLANKLSLCEIKLGSLVKF